MTFHEWEEPVPAALGALSRWSHRPVLHSASAPGVVVIVGGHQAAQHLRSCLKQRLRFWLRDLVDVFPAVSRQFVKQASDVANASKLLACILNVSDRSLS
jgi:hypothetical protein